MARNRVRALRVRGARLRRGTPVLRGRRTAARGAVVRGAAAREFGVRVAGSRGTLLGSVGAALLGVLCVTGCSGDGNPAGTASQAASAAASLASAASSALASATAGAGNSLASATAEAGRRFDEFRSGLNAKGEVKVGDQVRTDSDGRSTVEVTATNPTSTSRTYVVQVDFRDKGGNLLDTVVVKVDDVPADGSKDATARSTRSLSGAVGGDVARAVRT
ncbi:hypothetical protein ABZV34_17190 [Streptomyces sp. NPDC005195]|uniref:hypothetical protein n=1 Tax=Streptomyces sp. NPDC005195 TaxID=3154561 RepID=UPI0033BE6D21